MNGAGNEIPFRELCVELCETGGFDKEQRGFVHVKTCPYTILAQCVQGHYEIECGDGRRAVLVSGEGFLTGANLPLRIAHHGDPKRGFRMRAHWLHLHATLFGIVDVTSLLVLPLRVGALQCEPFAEIIETLARQDAKGAGAVDMLALRHELGFRTLRLLCALAPPREDAVELLQQQKRLGPVLSLMRERLAERITVAELARCAGLSVVRFHVFFRRIAGRPPMEFLKQMRLSEASRMLAAGDEPLRVVAERTGFCDEFHLSREFRRVFGKAPGLWRREHDRTLG